jgi:hypothetical protein
MASNNVASITWRALGVDRVTLYGVYDEAAYGAAFTAGRDPPRVDYTEPTLCGVSSWAPLVTGPMLNCALPAVTEAEEDAFANQTDGKGLNTGSELRDDQRETDENGTSWRADASFDGAFVDMHLGMDGLTMVLDNHFAMKCTIVLLDMFTMVADVLIKPGGGDDPGQLYMYFSFEWSIASGMEPFFVSGEIDMTPFSFDADITAMKDAKAYLGLVIRPGVFNTIIRASTMVVKLALWIVVLPLVLLIDLLCKATTRCGDASRTRIFDLLRKYSVLSARTQASFVYDVKYLTHRRPSNKSRASWRRWWEPWARTTPSARRSTLCKTRSMGSRTRRRSATRTARPSPRRSTRRRKRSAASRMTSAMRRRRRIRTTTCARKNAS